MFTSYVRHGNKSHYQSMELPRKSIRLVLFIIQIRNIVDSLSNFQICICKNGNGKVQVFEIVSEYPVLHSRYLSSPQGMPMCLCKYRVLCLTFRFPCHASCHSPPTRLVPSRCVDVRKRTRSDAGKPAGFNM